MSRLGSSPLARGLRACHASHHHQYGIIPARAGFTAIQNTPLSGSRDHPRSRGVYSSPSKSGRVSGGSSPLARGLPQHRGRDCRDPRIIPARAGFTVVCVMNGGACWDHPRSRGVYLNHIRVRSLGHGSSPLARGLHNNIVIVASAAGIIPARAGFTR